MKAVRNYGIEDIRVEEIDRPVPKQGEALIRILYAGICGSDLHIYRKGMFITYTPETMGHEFIGEITDANGGPFERGQLVVGDPRVPCHKCSACKEGAFQRCVELAFIGEVCQGCFTEYIAMPWDKLVRINKISHPEQGALAEPMAVALHICEEAKIGARDNVVVFGCGPIGLLTVTMAKKIYGAKTVTAIDVADERLKTAAKAGADYVYKDVRESEIKEYDKAVEAAGIGVTFQAALECLKPYGTLAMVGIFENPCTIDPNALIGKELRVIGSNTYTAADLEKVAEIINGESIDFGYVITQIIPFDEAANAFKALTGRDKRDLKILFTAVGCFM